jgi:hypothetical protein
MSIRMMMNEMVIEAIQKELRDIWCRDDNSNEAMIRSIVIIVYLLGKDNINKDVIR